MTPSNPAPQPVERITLDDLKHRANAVKDLAVNDAKDAVGKAVNTREVKTLGTIVAAFAIVAGVAYFMGTRARRELPPPPPPY